LKGQLYQQPQGKPSQLKYQTNLQNNFNSNQQVFLPSTQTYNQPYQHPQYTKTSPFQKPQVGAITSQNELHY
jgi:hypothetical protein